ncbi:MAG: hypothetical protein R3185_08605, partial [Candidatus Thermoplasmatota archaeon]|nr:hypothetical protein [Candidatus Thermoplasmatota archaeon]
LGARPRSLALGIATEILLPLVIGFAVGAALVLPAATGLDGVEGLAFPLTRVDPGGLVLATLAVLAGLLVVGAAIAAWVGVRAVSGLDQGALRQLGR